MRPQAKPDILVINDDPKVTWILEEGIGDDYSFRSSIDGVEGLNAIRSKPPDLVLLNIKMPRASGMWVLHEMRRLKIDLPVVIMSGFPCDYVLDITAGYRIDAFILDSWSAESVREKIDRVLWGPQPR